MTGRPVVLLGKVTTITQHVADTPGNQRKKADGWEVLSWN